MKKILIIVLIIPIVFGNCSNHQKNVMDNTCDDAVKYEADSMSDELFSDFIERFHSDTIFQAQRVSPIIMGYDTNWEDDIEDCEENDTIQLQYRPLTKEEVKEYLAYFDKVRKEETFSVEYELGSDSTATEKIFIEDTGCSYALDFKKQNGAWLFHRMFLAEV